MAFGIDDAIAAGSKLLDDAINKIWPDPAAKATAEAITVKAAADAAIETIRVQMAIPLAEAQSQDKWTSRARPSFLYTMYALILWGIPFSIISAFKPEIAKQMAEGFGAWLQAVPDSLWQVFGWSFAAYAAGRSVDKAIPFMKKK